VFGGATSMMKGAPRPAGPQPRDGLQRAPRVWLSLKKRRRNEMAGSLHVGLAALGAAIGVGLIGAGAAIAVGRNPGAATPVLVQSILSIAFAEAIVFYALFLVR
jgi:F-type H+-transporting ATPase subunit c